MCGTKDKPSQQYNSKFYFAWNYLHELLIVGRFVFVHNIKIEYFQIANVFHKNTQYCTQDKLQITAKLQYVTISAY